MGSAESGSGEWLPHVLDPTPSELRDLRDCCERLARAVRQYELDVSGQALESVCRGRRFDASSADVWRNLLDALATLGSWNAGDEPFAYDGSPDFLVDIAGWTDPLPIETSFPMIQQVYGGIVRVLAKHDLIEDPPVDLAIRWRSSQQKTAAFAWYSREAFECIADDMVESPGQGRTVASTMMRESAEHIASKPDYDVERIRSLEPNWQTSHGVSYEAIFVAEQRKRLVSEGTLPKDLPEHYRTLEHVVRPEEVFPKLELEIDNGEDSVADSLEAAVRMLESMFDQFCKRMVSDAHGTRCLVIKPEELPRYTGYSRFESEVDAYPVSVYRQNPFGRMIEIEALTRTRLTEGQSPLWFLNLFEEYKQIVKHEGPLATFAEYATRRFPDCVSRGGSGGPRSATAKLALLAPLSEQREMNERANDARRKVFISHSSEDKLFVRRLVDELTKRDLPVWFDERAMGVGDSIVTGISTGLSEADYLLVVLSRNSVGSSWVQNELNAALMEEASSKDIVVLPAVIDDCEIPILLRDRIYADFRKSFDNGLNGLLRVFCHELESARCSEPADVQGLTASDCHTFLAKLTLADLRRRMTQRLDRTEVATIWFDVLETKMENDMASRFLVECVIELLDRARKRNRLSNVIQGLCFEREDLANP